MSADDPDVAVWFELIERMHGAKASPLYMPASLLVVLIALDVDHRGMVSFLAFEPHFASLLSVVQVAGGDKAWEPFFHLSRSVGLWTLYDEHGPVDFADVPGGRPKARSRLLGKADRAMVEVELRPALRSLAKRAAVLSHLADALLGDDDATVRRLVVIASSLPEVRPGLLQAAGLAIL